LAPDAKPPDPADLLAEKALVQARAAGISSHVTLKFWLQCFYIQMQASERLQKAVFLAGTPGLPPQTRAQNKVAPEEEIKEAGK
jgi:hypothetical protein